MFAAEGGVIPETPAAPKKVDPYFSGRAMTQISNPTPASSFTPRKVGQAQGAAAGTFTPRKIGQTTGTYGVTPGQPTASQLAFRNGLWRQRQWPPRRLPRQRHSPTR